MGQFIVQMLFEAYMHLMPPRVVLWTLAAMLVAFLVFAGALSYGLIEKPQPRSAAPASLSDR